VGIINNSLYSSEKIEWSTPKHLFDKLNKEFNFTIDVCADKNNAKCSKFYTIQDDGLSRVWSGIIWMNPPYGRGIDKWIKKAFDSNCICVCLIPVRSDTRWWHKYVMRASEIRLLNKRLSFEGSNNKAPFPAAIVIFKPGFNNAILKTMEV
jgi:site-specific DNA-methyltransferase (adenine-specific)